MKLTPMPSTLCGPGSPPARIGGPLLIGLLLTYELSAASLFYAAAVPMLLAGILVVLLGVRYRT